MCMNFEKFVSFDLWCDSFSENLYRFIIISCLVGKEKELYNWMENVKLISFDIMYKKASKDLLYNIEKNRARNMY